MTPPELPLTAHDFSTAHLDAVCRAAHEHGLVLIVACAEVGVGDDGEPELGNYATSVQLDQRATLRPLAHQLAGVLEDSLVRSPSAGSLVPVPPASAPHVLTHVTNEDDWEAFFWDDVCILENHRVRMSELMDWFEERDLNTPRRMSWKRRVISEAYLLELGRFGSLKLSEIPDSAWISP